MGEEKIKEEECVLGQIDDSLIYLGIESYPKWAIGPPWRLIGLIVFGIFIGLVIFIYCVIFC